MLRDVGEGHARTIGSERADHRETARESRDEIRLFGWIAGPQSGDAQVIHRAVPCPVDPHSETTRASSSCIVRKSNK